MFSSIISLLNAVREERNDFKLKTQPELQLTKLKNEEVNKKVLSHIQDGNNIIIPKTNCNYLELKPLQKFVHFDLNL